MLAGLLAGLLSAVCFGLAAVAQARAVRRLPEAAHGLGPFVRAALSTPLLMAVVAAYLLGFVLHAVAIWLLPLYLAQAAIAMSLPVTAVASRRIGEGIVTGQWVALATVVAGLWLLAAGAGPAGAVFASWPFDAALAAGLVALAAAAALVHSPAALGTLSGLAYAGSAIGVRGVGWPLDPAMVVAALCVPAFGLLGFWLYSLGLSRGPVPSATAPMIVGQTAGPALVGLAFLDDGLRRGWWPALLLGLALAMAGAIAVGRVAEPVEVAA